MSFHKELQYRNIDNVVSVQFGLMSPEEIRRRSVVEVTSNETYNGNEPAIEGLFDQRMGVLDPGKRCPTDGLDSKFCPGYFGHIELATPVFHYQYISKYITKILDCICFRCSKLKMDRKRILQEQPNFFKLKDQARWKTCRELMSSIGRCGEKCENGCMAKCPWKYSHSPKENFSKICAEWKDPNNKDSQGKNIVTKTYLTAAMVLKILKRISDDDIETMGFSKIWCRPEWMICTVLAVPPPAVRPSVKQDNSQRMEDDLTCKLIEILKHNNELKKKIASNATEIDGWVNLLQYDIATFSDNEMQHISPACQRSGRPLKSIKQRLEGKEGRIRGNLMGKRVDYSARSVITPDPNINIDELGVPKRIAMNLTFPEIVSKYNIDKLQEMVKNGPFIYPGAKYIMYKKSNRNDYLEYAKNVQIEIGDTVHRHLLDGDIVLFNRQPSLHKLSMMAHKIRVMDYNTFRLNVSVTTPYNADFDGDEMNMHVPQSIQTQTELKCLVSVPLHVISPGESKPAITIVQDTLLGVYRLTREKGIVFNTKEFMNIMMKNNKFNGFIDPKKKIFSGHDIFTTILPRLSLNIGNKKFDNDNPLGKNSDNFVKINEGIMTQGILDKNIFAKPSMGLIQTVFNDFGYVESQKFIDNIQGIVTQYLLSTGFSVGISDLVVNKKVKNDMKNEIKKKKDEIQELTQSIHLNIFKNQKGSSNKDEFERQTQNLCWQARENGGKVCQQNLKKNNRMMNMINGGSKGSSVNFEQMVTCLGQQDIEGKRITDGFTNRTLPHFCKYDDSPEARGFVSSSFMGGLNPQEFYFHAMGGRIGLIDTAVKTSQTGYIQRRLMKSMEDLKVVYDLSVRSANNNIVQFLYGEDGIEATKLEFQPINLSQISNLDMMRKFKFSSNEDWSSFLDEDISQEITNDKNYLSKIETYYEDMIHLRNLYSNFIAENDIHTNQFILPVHFIRIINTTKEMFKLNVTHKSNIDPLSLYKEVEVIIEEIKKCNKTKISNKLFEIGIKWYLNPTDIIKNLRFTKPALDYLKLTIINKYKNSFVEPGEMVGVIAAQSIGEPATQMTLNTFHLAGVGEAANKISGVPRLEELLRLSKGNKLKSPSITAFLEKDIASDFEKAQKIKNSIEYIILKDITLSTKIYYDPFDYNTTLEEDVDFINVYKEFEDIYNEIEDKQVQSKLVLRFEFDRKMMLEKDITMSDIYLLINNYCSGKKISCIYSDDNANKIIFRFRINIDKNSLSKISNSYDHVNYLKDFEKKLLDITIKGIKNIDKAFLTENNNHGTLNPEGVLESTNQWVIETEGAVSSENMLETMMFDGVDENNVYSNGIHEIYELLGIEAARKALYKELYNIINEQGVNYRHLCLLIDYMTYKGSLIVMTRHGLNKSDGGPLAKCSFEQAHKNLLTSSIFGQTDNMKGISANIMMGQVAPCGTGLASVLLDEVKLFGNLESSGVKVDASSEEEEEEEEYEDDDEELEVDFDPDFENNENLDF